MKKISLHIVFWIFCLLFFSSIQFLWDRAYIDLTQTELIAVAIEASLLGLMPKMAFSYYLVYYATNRFIKKTAKFGYLLSGLIPVLLLCIIVDRWIYLHLVIPEVYHGLIKPSPLLDPRGVTAVILYMAFSSGLMMTIKLVGNQLAAKEHEKYLIKQKLEAELKFLRNQTNPHFLMNTLNNIYALARKKSDDTAEVVMRLSELLRFMLYESGGSFISLTDEIKLLQDYLELETIRYNNRLSIRFNKEIDTDSYQITPLLLLPFVENAFKHGISETRFESFIHIDLTVNNGRLHFLIENTKDDPSDNGKKNIGLINASRQLELSYSDYNLDIKSGNNTFTVKLFINLNSHVEI